MYTQLDQNVGLLFDQNLDKAVLRATKRMKKIEGIMDVDLDSVKESEKEYAEFQKEIRDYQNLLSFLHALRWLHPEFWGTSKRGKTESESSKENMILEEIRGWMRTQGEKLSEAIAPALKNPPEKLADTFSAISDLMRKEPFFSLATRLSTHLERFKTQRL